MATTTSVGDAEPQRMPRASSSAETHPELVISLPTTVGVEVVTWVRNEVAEAAPDAVAVLDFSHVRECHAWILAALVSSVQSIKGALFRARGLTDQQQRMLLYFRVRPEALGHTRRVLTET
jgi:hypothetical protein